jgi:hypothetical protein
MYAHLSQRAIILKISSAQAIYDIPGVLGLLLLLLAMEWPSICTVSCFLALTLTRPFFHSDKRETPLEATSNNCSIISEMG